MSEKESQKPKLPITPKTDSQRETRVLLEEVRANFKLLAEQYGSIAHKLEEHEPVDALHYSLSLNKLQINQNRLENFPGKTRIKSCNDAFFQEK